MAVKTTLPYPEEGATEPIETIRVEVVEGPDEGLSRTADSEALTIGTADGNTAVLTDPTVSRYHVELSRRADGIRVVDHASTNGTFIHGVRLEAAVVPPDTQLRLGRSIVRVDNGEPLAVDHHPDDQLGDLVGTTAVMRRLMARVGKAASTDAPLLVIGESGTGKELIARALHEQGSRSDLPFVTVDCGALAPNLVASELFGHEKGSFTGAEKRHIGAFERANGGTLFLDEIGELPRSLQPTLLGALERQRFRRVGGRDDIDIDVRVVAATHRDLRAEVNAGTFRLDLYYRLAVVTLRIPPLRDRPEDIPRLIAHFLRIGGHDETVEGLFPADVLDALSTHHFPGNVRELRNLVEASLAMGEAPDISHVLSEPPPASEAKHTLVLDPLLRLAYKDARAGILNDFEERYVRQLLERSGGNVAQGARDARMDRSHLFSLIKRHKLR